ncbi:MAG: exopolysaccharide biosynthesis polyprenyl glycosylphosphotransferase [Terriglobales bacterium]
MASAQHFGGSVAVGPDQGAWRYVWSRLPLDAGLLLLLLAFLDWGWPQLCASIHLSWNAVIVAGLAAAVLRPAYLLGARPWRAANAFLVVGTGDLADALFADFRARGVHGTAGAVRLCAMQLEDLQALARSGGRPWANRLVAAFPGGWNGVDASLRQQLQGAGCRLEEGTAWFERLRRKVPMERLERALDNRTLAPWTLLLKRVSDYCLSAAAVLLLWPLLLLLGLLIRLDSPGPAIFRQRRVGRGGRLFTLYKFRSMYVNADRGGKARPALQDDPRCTRTGKFLRRLRLDELPQLFNVLRGDMSLVGPRPFVPEQERECERAIPGYAHRWSVLPGATGWAQVSRGYCSDLADNTDKLAYDLFYVKHLSLWFDAKILFRTVQVMCLGRGAR